MGSPPPAFKRVVAAALAAAWLSAPLSAQAVAGPGTEMGAGPGTEPGTTPDREAALLGRLAQAETPEAAALIEAEIAALWSQSGSAAIDLLLRRGQDALEAGDPEAAIEHLTAAIDHDPVFAEAYAARAAAFYLTNRAGPALDDLREALVLNPRHTGALAGFAVLLEELGRPEDALELWRRLLDMDPQDAQAQAGAQRIGALTEGRAL